MWHINKEITDMQPITGEKNKTQRVKENKTAQVINFKKY